MLRVTRIASTHSRRFIDDAAVDRRDRGRARRFARPGGDGRAIADQLAVAARVPVVEVYLDQARAQLTHGAPSVGARADLAHWRAAQRCDSDRRIGATAVTRVTAHLVSVQEDQRVDHPRPQRVDGVGQARAATLGQIADELLNLALERDPHSSRRRRARLGAAGLERVEGVGKGIHVGLDAPVCERRVELLVLKRLVGAGLTH